MAEPTEPPSPPSPPKGDATPDAGNPGHATPPEVAPKPGRQSARKKAGDGEPPKRTRRTTAKKPAAATRKTASRTSATTAPKPRAPAPRRATARPRATGLSVATVPTPQPVDTQATDRTAKRGGRWWKALAGGIGAIAAGAALFSLRGSSRRKGAHQADGTDSSKSFDAGIADEGTIPNE
jgi:hypothetical protein